jgi:hypothetical protein
MSLDVNVLAETMIDAARAEVAALAEAGTVDHSGARHLAHMHQLNARSILVTVEGLGLLTAEQAIHAGIRAVSKSVNGAVQFALL